MKKMISALLSILLLVSLLTACSASNVTNNDQTKSFDDISASGVWTGENITLSLNAEGKYTFIYNDPNGINNMQVEGKYSDSLESDSSSKTVTLESAIVTRNGEIELVSFVDATGTIDIDNTASMAFEFYLKPNNGDKSGPYKAVLNKQ